MHENRLAAATRVPLALAQRPRNPLPRSKFGLAEAGSTYVGRITQHSPHRRPFPPRDRFPRWDTALVEHSRNRIDARCLLKSRSGTPAVPPRPPLQSLRSRPPPSPSSSHIDIRTALQTIR